MITYVAIPRTLVDRARRVHRLGAASLSCQTAGVVVQINVKKLVLFNGLACGYTLHPPRAIVH